MNTGSSRSRIGRRKLIQRFVTYLLTLTLILGMFPELSFESHAAEPTLAWGEFHMTDTSWTGDGADLVIDRHPSVEFSWSVEGIEESGDGTYYEAELYVAPLPSSAVKSALKGLADLNKWADDDPRRNRISGMGSNYWFAKINPKLIKDFGGEFNGTLIPNFTDYTNACLGDDQKVCWQLLITRCTTDSTELILTSDITDSSVDYSVGLPYMYSGVSQEGPGMAPSVSAELCYLWDTFDDHLKLIPSDTVSYEAEFYVWPGWDIVEPYSSSYGWINTLPWAEAPDINVLMSTGAWAENLYWFDNTGSMDEITPAPGMKVTMGMEIWQSKETATGGTSYTCIRHAPAVQFTVGEGYDPGPVVNQPSINPATASISTSSVTDLEVTKYDGDFTFFSILTDGVLVDADNYTVAGSTVTLKKEYLSTLSAGEHSITFHYTGTAGDGVDPVDPVLTLTVVSMCSPVLTVSGNEGIDLTADCEVVWKNSAGRVLSAPISVAAGTTLNYTVTPGDSLKIGGVQYYKETSGSVTFTEAQQEVKVALKQQGTVTVTAKDGVNNIMSVSGNRIFEDGPDIPDPENVNYTVKWYKKAGTNINSYSPMAASAGGGEYSDYTYLSQGRTSPMADAGVTLYCDIIMTGDNVNRYPNIEKSPVIVSFGNTQQDVNISAKNNIILSISGSKANGEKITADDYTVTWYQSEGDVLKKVAEGAELINLQSSLGKKFFYEITPKDYYNYKSAKTIYNWTEFHGVPYSEENFVTVTDTAQKIEIELKAVKKVTLEGSVTNGAQIGKDNLSFTVSQDPFAGYLRGSSYYSYGSRWNDITVTTAVSGAAVSFSAQVYDFDTTLKITEKTGNFRNLYKTVNTADIATPFTVTMESEELPSCIPLQITKQYPDGRAESRYGTTTLSRGSWRSDEGIFSDMVFTLKNGDTVIDPSLYQVTPSEVQFTGDVSAVIGMGDELTLSYTVADIKGEVDKTSSTVKVLRNYYASGLDWDSRRFSLSYKDQPNVYYTSPDGNTRHIIALYDANGDLTDTITDSYYGWTNSVPAGTYTIVNIRETGWLSAPATLEALQGILGTDEYLSEEVTLQNGICTVVNFDSSPQVKDHKTFTENSKFGEETVNASTDEWALVKLAYEVDPAIAKTNPGAQYAITIKTTMQSGHTYEQDVIPRYENTHTVGVASPDKYISLYCDNKLTESTVKINAYDNTHLGTIKGFTLYTDKAEGIIWFYVQAPKGGDFTITATGARVGANNRELSPQTFGNMTLAVTASGASLSFDSDYLRTKDNGSGTSNKNSAWLYTTPGADVKLYMDDTQIYSTRSNSAGVAAFVFTIDDSRVGNADVSAFRANDSSWTVAGEHELYAVTTKDGNSVRSAITTMECLTKYDFTPAVISTVSVKSSSDNDRDSFFGKSQKLLDRNYYKHPILSNYYWSLNDRGNVFTYEFTAEVEDGDRVDGDILLTVTGQNGEEYSTLLERVEGTNKFVGSVSDEKLLFTSWAVSLKSKKPDTVDFMPVDKDIEALIAEYGEDFKIVNSQTGQEQTIREYYNEVYNAYVTAYEDKEEQLVQDKTEVLDVFLEGMESYDSFLAGDDFDYSTLDNSEESMEALKAHFGIYEGKASDVDYNSWAAGSYSESTDENGRVYRATETSYIDDNGHLIMIWYSVMLPTDEDPDGYSYTQGLDCGQVIDPSLISSVSAASNDMGIEILKGGDEGKWPTMSDAGISKLASVGQIANDMHYRIVGKETTYSVTWAGMNAKYNVGALQTQHRQQTKAQISVETAIDGMLKDGGNKLDAETRQGLQEAKKLIREICRSTECSDFAQAMKVTMENINTVVSSLKGIAEDAAGATVDGVKYLKDKIMDEARSAAIDAAKGAIEDKIGVSIPLDVAEACSVLLDAYSSGKLGKAEKKTIELYLLMQSLAKKNKVRVNNANVGGNRSGGSARATHDPEGVIYEAVLSNTVEGATAVLYERNTTTGEETVWNAEDFGQINPQVTNGSGYYQWFVPEGEWQVRVTAPEGSGLSNNTSADNKAANLDDGSTAGWLPVMPVQLGINIPLFSTASPEVTASAVAGEWAELNFSLYMDVATLTEDTVMVKKGDETVSCNIIFPDKEADPADETKSYAKTVRLIPLAGTGFENGAAYTVVVTTDAKAYNGKGLASQYASAGLYTPVHVHSFTYTAEGSVITASCANDDGNCGIADHKVELQIVKPALETAGGTESAEAAFIGLDTFNAATGLGISTADIRYAGTRGTEYAQSAEAPVQAGNYTASLTVGEAKAVVDYFIAQQLDPAKAQYMAVFYTNGGSIIQTQIVEEGAKVKRPADPVKEGYRFDGWYSDSELTQPYDFETAVDKDVRIYAKWLKAVDKLELVSISITTAPVKTEYKEGERFDPAGMVVTAAYNDESSRVISDYEYSPGGRLKMSDTVITVSYTGDGKTCTATQDITVIKCEDGIVIAFDDDRLTLNGEQYEMTYTGAACKPAVIVTNNGEVLVEGVDYTVRYANNTNVSTKKDATVTVTGKSLFTGKQVLSFKIVQQDIGSEDVKVGGLIVAAGKKPTPVVSYLGNVLRNNKDYTFTVADGQVIITGAGNFTGSRSEIITELPAAEIKKTAIKVTLNKVNKVYNGEEQTLNDTELVVKNKTGDLILVPDVDYTVSYSANVDAGTVKVTVTGIGDYSGSVKKSFKINPAKDAAIAVTKDAESYSYVKTGAKPVLEVTADIGNGVIKDLVAGQDYRVSYSGNKKVGNAKFTLTFLGNYKGAKYKGDNTYIIEPAEVSAATTVVIAGDMQYKKAAKYQPKTYVIVDGRLITTADYKITYAETGKITLAAGESKECSVTVNPKVSKNAKYVDANGGAGMVQTYSVVADSSLTDVSKAKVKFMQNGKAVTKVPYTGREITFPYDGNGSEISIQITIGKTVISGADVEKYFDIIYADNTEKGKATVILSAKSGVAGQPYIGTCTGTINITSGLFNK